MVSEGDGLVPHGWVEIWKGAQMFLVSFLSCHTLSDSLSLSPKINTILEKDFPLYLYQLFKTVLL